MLKFTVQQIVKSWKESSKWSWKRQTL